ncbi:12144_t:CDS:2, partial [Acaulospora morrowiae]
PSASQNASKICDVIPYMAPEVLRNKGYTKASDIYSLAMIMSEMASGEPPFAEKRCWDADPTKRPNAVIFLKDGQENYSLILDSCKKRRPGQFIKVQYITVVRLLNTSRGHECEIDFHKGNNEVDADN